MNTKEPITGSARAPLRAAVWSNLVFLAPFMLAIFFGNVMLAALIAMVFTASTLYHFFAESEQGFFLNTDRVLGGILTLFNAGLVAFGGFTPPYFYIMLGLVPFALYFFRKQNAVWYAGNFRSYGGYHSLWHLTSALITVFSILTFYL